MIAVGAAVEPLGITAPVPMSGFAAREGLSEGEHDTLGARALALGDVVLVVVDVCALEGSTCRAIADRVLPARPDRVIVTATHTHAGPCSTPNRLTRCPPDVEQAIIAAAARAGTRARAARRPCATEHLAMRGVGIAADRRHPGRPVDPPVQMLRFTEAPGPGGGPDPERAAVVAALVTYPCHPVVLDGTNRRLSSDYVHSLRGRVEEAHPGAVAVFATGCAGDLNTGHPAEASYALDPSAGRTLAEARRVGTAIAEAVLSARPETIAADRVGVAAVPLRLALDEPDPEELLADLERWERELLGAAPGRAALLRRWTAWARERPRGTSWAGRVCALRLGAVSVVTLPGEPFLAVAEAIEERVGGPCLVLGYADDCPGYLPTAEEHAYGGYEVEDAHRYYGMPGPFARGSAELCVDEAVRAWRAAG